MHEVILVLAFAVFALPEVHASSEIAAVLEYSPVTAGGRTVNQSTAVAIMTENINQYESHIGVAAGQGATVMVFPEYGLYGVNIPTRDQMLPYLEPIPDPTGGPVAICGINQYRETTPILHKLSCLASEYNIDLIVDMGDVVWCKDMPSPPSDPACPDDGRFQYNTQVALLANGSLAAKYYKSHLYYEPQFNAPSVPRAVSFVSTRGTRIGLLICFDIMFSEPAATLLHDPQHKVEAFAYSTWWVNFVPLLMGTQVQSGWARRFSTHLLAAGAGTNWYNSGSGIYTADRHNDKHADTTKGSIQHPSIEHDAMRYRLLSVAKAGTSDRSGNSTASSHQSPPQAPSGTEVGVQGCAAGRIDHTTGSLSFYNPSGSACDQLLIWPLQPSSHRNNPFDGRNTATDSPMANIFQPHQPTSAAHTPVQPPVTALPATAIADPWKPHSDRPGSSDAPPTASQWRTGITLIDVAPSPSRGPAASTKSEGHTLERRSGRTKKLSLSRRGSSSFASSSSTSFSSHSSSSSTRRGQRGKGPTKHFTHRSEGSAVQQSFQKTNDQPAVYTTRASAAVDDLVCTVSVRTQGKTSASDAGGAPVTSVNGSQYAVIAAQGMYHNLFPAKLCVFVHCPSGDIRCMEQSRVLQATQTFTNIQLESSIVNSTIWTVFSMGSYTDGPALLGDSITAQQGPTSASMRTQTPGFNADRPVLSLSLVGLNFTGATVQASDSVPTTQLPKNELRSTQW